MGVVKFLLWIGWVMLSVVGLVTTYLPLAADVQGKDIWGLQWQYWLMMGITILLISIAVIIGSLFLKYNALTSKEAQQKRDVMQKGIEALSLMVEEQQRQNRIREEGEAPM